MTATSGDMRLSQITTMRVGGPGEDFVFAQDVDTIIETVRAADDAGTPLLVVGGGSNVVVADDGFAGTVLQVGTRGISVETDDLCGGVIVHVQAGEPWDDFVAQACEQEWSGIEALSGIPGSTGATPVQNVGAYGQEVSQTIWQVKVYDRVKKRIKTLFNADCQFAYRHSLLKATIGGEFGPSPRYIVLSVAFQLRPTSMSQPVAYAALAHDLGVELGERVPLQAAREAVLAQRAQRGMVLDPDDHDTWSCGSFFTNPIIGSEQMAEVRSKATALLGDEGPKPPEFPQADGSIKTSAAWLIDKAGYGKGYGAPAAATLSTKHPLAITNRGEAGSEDVVALAREIRAGVLDAFGVELVNEPVFVGLELA